MGYEGVGLGLLVFVYVYARITDKKRIKEIRVRIV